MAEQQERAGTDLVVDWLLAIDGIVPPFSVEVVMVDGSRYSLHSIDLVDEDSGTAIIAIWDFRGLSDEELDELKQRLAVATDRAILAEASRLHAKLAIANARIRIADVAHCVEAPDPLWPDDTRPHIATRKSIGFDSGAGE